MYKVSPILDKVIISAALPLKGNFPSYYVFSVYTILSRRSEIRHWSKFPVSVRADRWLRACRRDAQYAGGSPV